MNRHMRSGWCENGFCGRCAYVLQTANARRREIHCDCACHTALVPRRGRAPKPALRPCEFDGGV